MYVFGSLSWLKELFSFNFVGFVETRNALIPVKRTANSGFELLCWKGRQNDRLRKLEGLPTWSLESMPGQD